MKKIILSIFLIFLASAFLTVKAQITPAGAGAPPGGGDKNLADDGIKMRSVEMERMKKEAKAAEAASYAPINKEITLNFPQIKEDFEGIQILDAAIIKAYTTGDKIDYKLIETSSDGINQKAKRLDSNLFAANKGKNDDKLTEKVDSTKSVRDLIIELDTVIGDFVSSKIFGNIQVIEPEDAIKTRKDLDKIQYLSEKLSEEAKKMK